MSLLTIQTHLQFKKICQMIIGVDPTIRFVGIVNNNGRLITGSSRKNIELQVPKNECEMLYMEAVLEMRMHREFDHCLGQVDFEISHRNNFIITKIPFLENLVYISAEKDYDFAKTPFLINQILKIEKSKFDNSLAHMDNDFKN